MPFLRSLQPGSARGHPSHEKSPQPGCARGNPSHDESPQRGSARGNPSHEKSPQPGSASGTPRMPRPAFAAPLSLCAAFLCAATLADETPIEKLPSPDTSPLFWTQEERIVGFRNFDAIYDTRRIGAGENHLRLVADPQDFGDVTYSVDGQRHTLDDYLETFHVAGLLVVKGDRILLERYRLGHSETARWVSFSIAKSVTSLLIGAAIRDGYIESLDEPAVDYLPRLRGSAYDGASIKDILQMASGVGWDEDYANPDSDVARAGGANGMALIRYLDNLAAEAEPGTRFNYNTGETNLVGALLRAAIGNNASSYLEAKIWSAFMEHPASWSINAGSELGGCCIHATLRDYARIGLFALRDGALVDGTKVLPDGWMRESTTPSAANPGYGYLWWLWDAPAFAAIGIFGQLIWIDPRHEVVVVTQGAAPAATGADQSAHRSAVLDALYERAIGG